jgi:hypothetical protein
MLLPPHGSNLGKWDGWYADLEEPGLYGGHDSYLAAAEWLEDCETVGDWGCGMGWFSTLVEPPRQYFGFDGSQTPFACQVVDLADFRFETEGVLVRHVIEHDPRWSAILANAAASFTQRMMLILFTPMLSDDELVRRIDQVSLGSDPGGQHQSVPDLSFSVSAILSVVDPGLLVDITKIPSDTAYGTETLFRFERPTQVEPVGSEPWH